MGWDVLLARSFLVWFGATWTFCAQTANLSDPLLVAVPTVRIDGGDPEMYVESGSSVVLRCHISNWLQKPQIVFWYDYKTITRFIWPSFLARWKKKHAMCKFVLNLCQKNVEDNPPSLCRFRDGQRIATSPSGDTEVKTSHGRDAIESRLTIARAAAARHSGTYECSTDNIKPAKINLHVVEGIEKGENLNIDTHAINGSHAKTNASFCTLQRVP